MPVRCRLLLVTLSASWFRWFATVIGARLSMRSMHPASDGEVYDLVMYEEPKVTNVTSKTVFGCEKAVKLLWGKTESDDNVFSWECLRCKPGYLEATTLVSVPTKTLARFKNIKGKIEQKKQICKWKPGGSLCSSTRASSSGLKQKLFGGYDLSCVECSVLARNVKFVDADVPTVNPSGTRVSIKRMCSATVASDAATWTEPNALMSHFLAMFEQPSLARLLARSVPIHMVQLADEFRVLVTHKFLSDAGTDAGKVRKDMVGDGAKFMRSEIEHAIGSFRSEYPERLNAIAHAFVESGIIQDIRGSLGLCFLVAMKEMDGTERDAKYVNAGKACRSTDYVFAVVLDFMCSGVIESAKCDAPDTDYASIGDAPQRALEILRMFGAIE